MTAVDEQVTVDAEAPTDESGEAKGRKRDRDFTKFSKLHEQIADYVNANSGLEPVTPNQVKAVITLRVDFANTDDQVAARKASKDAREAAAAKYQGMSDDQIKIEKAAEKAEKQADKLRARVEEALAKAKALREGTEATGEDLVAAVEAEQSPNGADAPEEAKPKISRRR